MKEINYGEISRITKKWKEKRENEGHKEKPSLNDI